MGFFDKVFSSLAGAGKRSADDYVDLGEGLPWFQEYSNRGNPTLSDFFGLQKASQIKIKATIGKIGYYQTPKGKRWAVIARYFDNEKQKEFTFYCPGWEYDPISEYGPGDALEMYVDKDNYEKYEMPIY